MNQSKRERPATETDLVWRRPWSAAGPKPPASTPQTWASGQGLWRPSEAQQPHKLQLALSPVPWEKEAMPWAISLTQRSSRKPFTAGFIACYRKRHLLCGKWRRARESIAAVTWHTACHIAAPNHHRKMSGVTWTPHLVRSQIHTVCNIWFIN